MGVQARKQLRMGPLRFNFTLDGFSSWGWKIGPWSWNSRQRRLRTNLPGPFHHTGRRR